MQPCRWYQLEFPATLSGELCNEQADRVWSHVDSCPACREELQRFRMVESLLSEGLPEPERASEFQRGFLQRLESEIRREKRLRHRRFVSDFFHPALLPLAAAASIAAFLVWRWPMAAPGGIVPQPESPAAVVADAQTPASTGAGAAPEAGGPDAAVRSVAASPVTDAADREEPAVTPVADAIIEPTESEVDVPPAESEVAAEPELQQGAALGIPDGSRAEYAVAVGLAPDAAGAMLVADRGR